MEDWSRGGEKLARKFNGPYDFDIVLGPVLWLEGLVLQSANAVFVVSHVTFEMIVRHDLKCSGLIFRAENKRKGKSVTQVARVSIDPIDRFRDPEGGEGPFAG